MNILVCIKRVPFTGGKINLTADGQEIETKHLGFTISPHEECAVEEAVRLSEAQGASTTALTLGPAPAEEQLRDAMAMGIGNAILLETDGREWDPTATADAVVEAVRAEQADGIVYDALFFGNEAGDTGDYQVGIRVAHALDLPCVTGIKALEIKGGMATARREAPGGWEVYEVSLPAVFTMKEGINLPRYPPLMGRLKAKKKEIKRLQPQWRDGGLTKMLLKLPGGSDKQVEILGNGPGAAPRVVEVLQKLGLIQP
jgi:electron transfer flavoprotein beta subunit